MAFGFGFEDASTTGPTAFGHRGRPALPTQAGTGFDPSDQSCSRAQGVVDAKKSVVPARRRNCLNVGILAAVSTSESSSSTTSDVAARPRRRAWWYRALRAVVGSVALLLVG